MIGQVISHYKVLEKLGEGGMGVVYKAEDLTLKRIVALKFLPPHVSASETDKARFLLEAQAAAALSHPNICTIYGIEEYEGNSFIAMEFVDGHTLHDMRGTINLHKAVDIGIQVAEGLGAAHDKGIVHRDIKPENIMLRKDGIVQVMDFGLAKLRASRASRLTKEGSTVGTAGYMSPEQIQGQETDHRSDIFSLGVLLYELFAGQPPFKGVHETALLYEIVNVDPAPMSAVKPEIEGELDRIVLECLQKDPDERYNSVKDIAKDLKRFKRESSRQRMSRSISTRPAIARSTSQVETAQPEPANLPHRRSLREWLGWGIALLLVAALVFVLLRPSPQSPVRSSMIRSSIILSESLYIHSYGPGSGRPAFSSDGRLVAFQGIQPDGSGKIFVRSMEDGETRPISGTENGVSPFWSPDGKMLGFFADGRMKKVDLVGGSPTTIAAVPNQRGGTWNRDDIIVYCPDYQDGLFHVTADGKGTPQQLTTLDSARHEGSHRWPQFLPDGKHFLYLARTAAETGDAEGDAIFVGSLDGKEKKMLVQSSFNASYADGYLVFARNQALMAQKLDMDILEVSGDPIKIASDVLNDPGFNIAVFTVSQNGLLLYQPGPTIIGARPLLVDRSGAVIRTLGDNLMEQDQPSFSPDGQQIAMYMYDLRSRRSNVWLYNLKTNDRRRLTTRPTGDFFPAWTPDGSSIYFSSGGFNNSDIFRQSTTHGSKEEQVFGSPKNDRVSDVSPDGTTLLLESLDLTSRLGDLLLLPTSGKNRTPIEFQATRFDEKNGKFSPDGKWVAFVSDESGEDEVYIKQANLPNADPMKVSAGGGDFPHWGSARNELIYLNAQHRMVALTLEIDSRSVTVKSTKELFRAPMFHLSHDYSRAADAFVFTRFVEVQKHAPLALVMGWTERLHK